MIVDSSALLAVLLDEADAELIARTMARAKHLRMSAANWLETSMVVDGRLRPKLHRSFDQIIVRLAIRIEPVTRDQAVVARQANRDYGRGRHPAKLNYGDCFAYSLAKMTGEPLLFKGNDFSQTDIEPALKA